jgi:hypothetical protein
MTHAASPTGSGEAQEQPCASVAHCPMRCCWRRRRRAAFLAGMSEAGRGSGDSARSARFRCRSSRRRRRSRMSAHSARSRRLSDSRSAILVRKSSLAGSLRVQGHIAAGFTSFEASCPGNISKGSVSYWHTPPQNTPPCAFRSAGGDDYSVSGGRTVSPCGSRGCAGVSKRSGCVLRGSQGSEGSIPISRRSSFSSRVHASVRSGSDRFRSIVRPSSAM